MKALSYFSLLAFFFLAFNLSNSQAQNNSLSFDRTDDQVQTTFAGVLGGADRTFEAWVNVSATAPSANLCILDYGRNAALSRNTFVVTGARGVSFISGGANFGTSAGIITAGQWHHVAFVLSSGTGFIYVDGVQAGTSNISTVNTPSGFADVTIGERVAGGSIRFGGLLDEVRIWNVARTATEIANSRNTELAGTETGLVAYFKFDEDQASCDLIDCAGNNHGTRQGTGGLNVLPALTSNVPNITDVACGVTLQGCTLPCRTFITAISTSNISACDSAGTTMDPNDDTFTADVTVDFNGTIPTTGTLNINGDGSAGIAVGSLGSTTSHTFTGVTMRADGGPINLSAIFSDEPCSTFRNANAGAAPSACSNGGGIVVVPSIPTMSEWGLIIFGLIIFGLSLVFGLQHRSRMAMPGNGTAPAPFSARFEFKTFARVLPMVYLAITAIFVLAIGAFGYELTNADVPGSLIAGAIVAYLIQFIMINTSQENK